MAEVDVENGAYIMPNGIPLAAGGSFKGLEFGANFAGKVAKGSGRHTGGASEDAVFLNRSLLQLGKRAKTGTVTVTIINLKPSGADGVIAFEAGMTDMGVDADGAWTIPDGTVYSVFMFNRIKLSSDNAGAGDDDTIFWLLGNGVTWEYEIFTL